MTTSSGVSSRGTLSSIGGGGAPLADEDEAPDGGGGTPLAEEVVPEGGAGEDALEVLPC